MDFLSQHAITPTGHYMILLEFLAVLVYSIHLPYVGIVIGSVALSSWLTFRDREVPNSHFNRFAGDLIDVFLGNRYAMFVLGVFPLFALPFIYSQWFVGLEATTLRYIPLVIPAVAVGFVTVAMYASSYADRRRRYGRHMLMGLMGVGILKVSYFVLLASVVRLNDPEKWFRIKNIWIMLLNWNVIWKFAFFMHAAIAITGAAILFFFFGWRREQMQRDPNYALFVRRFGGGLALGFTMALPVFYLFYIFTTPDVAFNNTVYVLASAVGLVSMIIALFLVGTLSATRPRFGGIVFSLLLTVFVLAGSVDLIAMNRANWEHYRLIEQAAEEKKAARSAEMHALLEGGPGPDAGERIFQSICSACHRMDVKLVGPALDDVLSGYQSVEALASFIANPTRKNPDYPPMPSPGLSSADAKAVAGYLLGASVESGGGH